MIILSNVYRVLINTGERVIPVNLKKLIKWDHPAGPKYIHFWAPFMKWVIIKYSMCNFIKLQHKINRDWLLQGQLIWQDQLKNYRKIRRFHYF